jgi:hypothetical protein
MRDQMTFDQTSIGRREANSSPSAAFQLAQDICPKHFLLARIFFLSFSRLLGHSSSAYFCPRLSFLQGHSSSAFFLPAATSSAFSSLGQSSSAISLPAASSSGFCPSGHFSSASFLPAASSSALPCARTFLLSVFLPAVPSSALLRS